MLYICTASVQLNLLRLKDQVVFLNLSAPQYPDTYHPAVGCGPKGGQHTQMAYAASELYR